MTNNNGYILALDVGEKRIGMAIASLIARLPRALKTLNQSDGAVNEIADFIKKENVVRLVVGLPRSLSGNDSAQTKYARQFADKLRDATKLEVIMQDEALTSKKAEAELRARGSSYEKGDIDALAAIYILEDYLATIGSAGSAK